jgi:uncharacterized membrane protein
MTDATQSQARRQDTITISSVIAGVSALCVYALFFKAYEVTNWPGFWFSVAHVVIVAAGTWLALCKVR